MTESFVAFTRDWRRNHALAERLLDVVLERGITTVYHFGEYGARPDRFGRDWFAERMENQCAKRGMHIWVSPSPEDEAAWEVSRQFALASADSLPVVPRTGQHQLMLTTANTSTATARAVTEDLVDIMEAAADHSRVGILNPEARHPKPRWIPGTI